MGRIEVCGVPKEPLVDRQPAEVDVSVGVSGGRAEVSVGVGFADDRPGLRDESDDEFDDAVRDVDSAVRCELDS